MKQVERITVAELHVMKEVMYEPLIRHLIREIVEEKVDG